MQNDWEINPDNYLKDESGEFVLKVDGTPKKKGGRKKGTKSRNYTYSKATKDRIQANRTVRNKEKLIQKAEAKLKAQKQSLRASRSTLSKIDNSESSKEGKIVSNVEDLPTSLQKEIENKNVIFSPNDGPQTEFLAAPQTDVLYGGAAGGGKSYAMIVDPLRYAHREAHRALVLRRSMPELRELIDKSRELYPKAFPGCKFREVEKIWTFPSGAKVELSLIHI